MIGYMVREDWPKVRDIYLEGLATGHASFETNAPSWEKWNDSHHDCCRLVWRHSDEVKGWAALKPVSPRPVYRGVAEVSVYVRESMSGQGIGTSLLEKLILESEQHGIWTLQAGIFPENNASILLHKRCGFREVGIRERMGCMNGEWRDVVLMERRSTKF